MGVVNGCYTIPVNVIKFKINYSCFFRDVEKTKYALNACQFRWKVKSFCDKSQLKSKILSISYAVRFVIDHK